MKEHESEYTHFVSLKDKLNHPLIPAISFWNFLTVAAMFAYFTEIKSFNEESFNWASEDIYFISFSPQNER